MPNHDRQITSASEIELVTILQMFAQLVSTMKAPITVPEDTPELRGTVLEHVAATVSRTNVRLVATRV
jgi:hypothetical protein